MSSAVSPPGSDLMAYVHITVLPLTSRVLSIKLLRFSQAPFPHP